MHERGKWQVIKNTLRGIGFGVGVGSVSGILAAGIAPDLLPEPPRRIIFVPPPPQLINYGYDPLENCPKNSEVFTDKNILLQHGQPVIIGGVQVEANFGKLNAVTTQSQSFVDETVTIRAGYNGSERTYYVQIGDKVILDENNPLGKVNEPIVYKASITGYCGYSKPYGPYLQELADHTS